MIEEIKNQNLLEYIQKVLCQEGKREGNLIVFKISSQKTGSLKVYPENNYTDFSDTYGAGSIIDFQMHYFGQDKKEAIKTLANIFKIQSEKKIFIKSPKHSDLINNFEKYRIFSSSSLFNNFLATRGLNYDEIQKENIHQEFGICENLFLPKIGENRPCILFPCMDENKQIIGIKYRRIDGQLIGDVKEMSINGSKSGLIYDEINENEMIICEGPPDYMILKYLGYNNVICNAGGVQANKELLKKLLYKTTNIISFYDNDLAGQQANQKLEEVFNRKIRVVNYPSIDGGNKDINELFKIGYRKKDFDVLVENANFTEKIEIEKYNIKQEGKGYIYEKQIKDLILNLKISNFTLKLIDILEFEKGDEVERHMVIEVIQGHKIDIGVFNPKDICEIQSFKKKIKGLNPSCSFFELNPTSLDELIRYVEGQEDTPYTIVVNKKGYIPKYNCWSFQEGILFEQKFYEFNNQMTANIGKIKIKLDIKKDYKFLPVYETNYYNEDIKNEIIPHFQHMFGGINGDLVLGFLISTLFLNNLRNELRPFPILFIFGKKGSGKTSAVEIALKILGIENSVNNAESDSIFVDQYNSNIISSLPYWSDEYKNGKRTKEKEAFYKTLFDRNGVSKGTVTDNGLGLNIMDVNCSLILSGEQTPNDDALYSRTCVIDVNGNREGNLFDEIKKKSDYYPSVLRNLLEKYSFNSLIEIYKKGLVGTNKILKEKGVEKRLLNVYAPIITGYIFYERIILGKKEIDNLWLQSVIEKIHIKEEKEKEDILDAFFTKVFFLFGENYHNDYLEHIRYNTNLININFSFIYSLYEANTRDNIISKKDLKEYLEKEYGAKRSSMNKLDEIGKRSHTLSFTIEKDKYPKIFDSYFNINFKQNAT